MFQRYKSLLGFTVSKVLYIVNLSASELDQMIYLIQLDVSDYTPK